jgi:hypothetical protein
MNSPQHLRSTVENVTYDSTLNQYEHKVLFPNKLALANAMLAEYGVPAEFEAEQRQRTAQESKNASVLVNDAHNRSASNT